MNPEAETFLIKMYYFNMTIKKGRTKGYSILDSNILYKNRLITLPPMTLREWQKVLDIKTSQIYKRLKDGDFIPYPQDIK